MQRDIDLIIKESTANVSGIQGVSILVEGKPRETLAGHADLTQFFDVATMAGTVGGQ